MRTSSGLILVGTENMVPPKQYLQLAYAKFPTFGASLLRLETPELVIASDAALPPLDALLKDLEENKEVPSILYFAHSNTALSTESEQPFVILRDAAGNAIAAAFIEGEYPTKQHADSAHTDEYHIFDDVLGPQLKKIYTKICSGDMEKFEEELLDDANINLFNSLSINRGVIVIQTITGKVFKFEKGNDLGHEFPWGWVSNKLGFAEKSSKEEYVPFEEPKPAPARRSMSDRFKKTPTVPLVIANTEPAKLDVGTTIAKANETAASADVLKDAARPKISCPADIIAKGKNAYTGWYETHCVKPLPTKEQMKAGIEWPANDEHIAKNQGKYGKLSEKAAEMKEKILASKGKLPDPPIIQPNTRHIINTLLDSGEIKAKLESGKILSSDELKEPPKSAPWSAQFGRDLMEVYRWDREIIGEFIGKCETNKDRLGIILLIEELTRENMKLMLDDKKPSDTKAEKEMVSTATAELKAPETNNESSTSTPPPVKSKSASRFAKKAA